MSACPFSNGYETVVLTESARMVLKPDGEIRIALCHGQGGMPADSLQE
jgi:hypothetical protein